MGVYIFCPCCTDGQPNIDHGSAASTHLRSRRMRASHHHLALLNVYRYINKGAHVFIMAVQLQRT